jgi:hypothetical protein
MIKISTPKSPSHPKKLKIKSLTANQTHLPSDAVLSFILNFSKALSVKKLKSIGFIENLMN